MKRPRVTTDTVQVSRLGCMRKSTLIQDDKNRTVEHVELWTESDDAPPAARKPRGATPGERQR